MGFKIGSFNMYKFSYQTDKEISKNLEKIKEIIIGEEFDIVAMQEVFTQAAAIRLATLLNGSPLDKKSPYKNRWFYSWAQPKSRSTQAAEGYAFLWNTRKFRLATGLKQDEQDINHATKTFNARIHDNYTADRLLYEGKLVRDPFYARFESINGWFEVRLINTHIMFKDKTTKETGEVSWSDTDKRQKEFSILIDIYRQLADKQYRSCRPSYTFLLGDYNLCLNREWTKSPYLQEVVEIQKEGQNGIVTKRIITVQDQLTTLKGRSPKSPDEPVRGFANNYDHFTYDEIRFEGIGLNCQRVDSVRKYCNDDFELHRKAISDHVPICMSINLNGR